MMHYHGTPIGGKSAGAAEFIAGRFVLVPWKRPDDLLKAMECSRGFVIDNSAFSFWSTHEAPDWQEYVAWLHSFARHPRFHWAIIPDVIDGGERENDALLQQWFTWNGQAAKASGVMVRGVPVWHMHESLDRLFRLCRNYSRVAIGSSGQWPTPGVGGWWDRMDEAFDRIIDGQGYPIAKIHGLRMLRRDIIERYPLASADSTNAVQNGARESLKIGTDTAWGAMTLARRIEQSQSPSSWVKSKAEQGDLFAKVAQ